jgi:hypothetical protein
MNHKSNLSLIIFIMSAIGLQMIEYLELNTNLNSNLLFISMEMCFYFKFLIYWLFYTYFINYNKIEKLFLKGNLT